MDAHTQIVPPFVSAKTTNKELIDYAQTIYSNSEPITIPSYVISYDIEKPINIYSSVTKNTKIFDKDTLVEFGVVGNVGRFEFSGNTPQDHIYIAQYVQPRFWNWLRDLWQTNEGVYF
ncbi:MAG: hypothetical protein HC877_23310 [Thioploca sp.]|nr:hypothetical protein [Thioploca sp.]